MNKRAGSMALWVEGFPSKEKMPGQILALGAEVPPHSFQLVENQKVVSGALRLNC